MICIRSISQLFTCFSNSINCFLRSSNLCKCSTCFGVSSSAKRACRVNKNCSVGNSTRTRKEITQILKNSSQIIRPKREDYMYMQRIKKDAVHATCNKTLLKSKKSKLQKKNIKI